MNSACLLLLAELSSNRVLYPCLSFIPLKAEGLIQPFDRDGWISICYPTTYPIYPKHSWDSFFLTVLRRGETENPSPYLLNSECLKSSNHVQLIIQVATKLWSLIREPPWGVFFWLGSEDPNVPKKRSGMRKNHQVGWKRYRWWIFWTKNFLAWRYQSLVQEYLWKLISFFRNSIQIPIIQYHFFKDNTTRNWGTNMFS